MTHDILLQPMYITMTLLEPCCCLCKKHFANIRTLIPFSEAL